MAEKLSWTELRRILATRAGVSEKEAGAFLSALNAEILEALKTDKQVRINGLGLFKLQAVAPRKSVNVATGEAITIEGYNKVAFVPEAGVKELIEKSGEASIPEGKGEVDPIKKLGTQAEEIVDILGELGQSPKEEKSLEDAPLQDGAEAPSEEPVAEPVFYVPGAQHEPEPEPEQPKKKEKKHHFLRDTLICVVILLLLLLVGYFFLRSQLSEIIGKLLPEKPQTEQVEAEPAEQVVAEPVEQAEEELTEEQILAEFLAISEGMEVSEEPEVSEAPSEANYDDLITIEPMHEASRLTWMAKRFYGSKAYWPYIYEANKDHISNPSNIDVGTPIRVPRLTEAQKDTTTAAYKRLLEEAEAACEK